MFTDVRCFLLSHVGIWFPLFAFDADFLRTGPFLFRRMHFICLSRDGHHAVCSSLQSKDISMHGIFRHAVILVWMEQEQRWSLVWPPRDLSHEHIGFNPGSLEVMAMHNFGWGLWEDHGILSYPTRYRNMRWDYLTKFIRNWKMCISSKEIPDMIPSILCYSSVQTRIHTPPVFKADWRLWSRVAFIQLHGGRRTKPI